MRISDEITLPTSGPPAPTEAGSSQELMRDARMHPLTLRFGSHLEGQFADEHFTASLPVLRAGLVLGFVLYATFGILDTWIAPQQREAIWFIRFAIECPMIVASLAYTWHPSFRRHYALVMSIVTIGFGLGIIAMTAIIPPPGSYLYYAGLMLVVIFTCTLARLPFPTAMGVILVVITSYVVIARMVSGTATPLLVNNLFFLVATATIAGIACYMSERLARMNFVQRRIIELRTREVEAKNAELWQRNRELAESRAATIRSARRSELIFSALSEALPGTVLDDKYRVEDKIGSGAFGTVYRGEHILLHHPVAIKVFRPSVGSGSLESLDRFRLEGISTCRINHPNAVTVLDFEVSAESIAYLVMELLEGRSLADELQACGRIPPRRAARIAASVCSVLAEAHAAGILHRDIKPSNVFLHQVKGEEVVKVIDFGIAKLTDASQEQDLQRATVAGMLVGTPTYMAPERLDDAPYDGRTDVYSVGIMLYEMLAGRPPFVAPEGRYWTLAMMHTTEAPQVLTEVAPGVPAQLSAMTMQALAKDPAGRPTAAQLGAALHEFLDAGVTA